MPNHEQRFPNLNFELTLTVWSDRSGGVMLFSQCTCITGSNSSYYSFLF